MAIINALRKRTQVELVRTDAIALGMNPPLRESGHLDGTPGFTNDSVATFDGVQ